MISSSGRSMRGRRVGHGRGRVAAHRLGQQVGQRQTRDLLVDDRAYRASVTTYTSGGSIIGESRATVAWSSVGRPGGAGTAWAGPAR